MISEKRVDSWLCRDGGEKQVSLPRILVERLTQFLKFCIVGGTGVFVDMAFLYLLADPSQLGLDVTLSKLCAAQAAMINNFIWNELWTFRCEEGATQSRDGVLCRLLLFNGFCAIGIGLAVFLLHVFHTWLGWNLYLSNLLAIVLVTLWNFEMNARFNWKTDLNKAGN